MKRLILFLLCLVILVNCSNRRKHQQTSEITRTESIVSDTNIIVSEEIKVQNIEKEIKKIEQKEKVNEGEIIIKGKTDSVNDFHFHNIVDGDTLSDWYIKGNAEFVIKNRFKNNEKKTEESNSSEKINIVAEIARKSVAQSTIKDFAEKLKASEKDVSSTGFTFPIYLIIAGAVLFIILLIFLWRKFGGSVVDRINKFKNKTS